MSRTLTTNKHHLFLLLVLLCYLIGSIACENGWFQGDANGKRNRLRTYWDDLQRVSTYFEFKTTPSSIVMSGGKTTCAISYQDEIEKVVCFNLDGSVRTTLDVPSMYELIDVAPVFLNQDNYNLNYFTVRRNSATGEYFILNSDLTQGMNVIMQNTQSRLPITNMILNEESLVFTCCNSLTSISNGNGNKKWVLNLDTSLGSQFLLDSTTLYILTPKYLTAVNIINGRKLRTLLITNTFTESQLFLQTEQHIIVPDATGNAIHIIDSDRFEKGILNTFYIFGKQSRTSFDHCTNIFSDNSDIYMVCRMNDDTFSALGYHISNTGSVSLKFEINTRSIPGQVPIVCSHKIAHYGNEMFGFACDSGLYSFMFSGEFHSRKVLTTIVHDDTQVFGTYEHFAIYSSVGDMTFLQHVDRVIN